MNYYSPMVKHCLRFYSHYPIPGAFKSKADKDNWLACDKAIKTFAQDEQEILLYIYRQADTVADNIYQVCRERNLNQDAIWRLVLSLEHKVAVKRGLI